MKLINKIKEYLFRQTFSKTTRYGIYDVITKYEDSGEHWNIYWIIINRNERKASSHIQRRISKEQSFIDTVEHVKHIELMQEFKRLGGDCGVWL